MNRRARALRQKLIVLAVGLPILLGILIWDGLWIDVAIVVVVGLFVFLPLLGTRKVVKDIEARYPELADDVGEQSEAMLAVDAFDDAIHGAYEIPFTDQVRLSRREVERLLERLRAALSRRSAESLALFAELDGLVRNAKSFLFGEQIRLDREEVYDILDRMRASFAEER